MDALGEVIWREEISPTAEMAAGTRVTAVVCGLGGCPCAIPIKVDRVVVGAGVLTWR